MLGNHEVLNALGVMTYVSPSALEKFPDRERAFLPGMPLAAELATWPVACVVGDTAFCHGGLTKLQALTGFRACNEAAANWLLARPQCTSSGYCYDNYMPPEVLYAPGRDTPSSPLWTRHLSHPASSDPTPE